MVDSSGKGTRRESASQIDEFFEDAVVDTVDDTMSERFSGVVGDWEDITTSLSKIDPDIADMLELVPVHKTAPVTPVDAAVKIEPCDDCTGNHHLLRAVHSHSDLGNSLLLALILFVINPIGSLINLIKVFWFIPLIHTFNWIAVVPNFSLFDKFEYFFMIEHSVFEGWSTFGFQAGSYQAETDEFSYRYYETMINVTVRLNSNWRTVNDDKKQKMDM